MQHTRQPIASSAHGSISTNRCYFASTRGQNLNFPSSFPNRNFPSSEKPRSMWPIEPSDMRVRDSIRRVSPCYSQQAVQLNESAHRSGALHKRPNRAWKNSHPASDQQFDRVVRQANCHSPALIRMRRLDQSIRNRPIAASGLTWEALAPGEGDMERTVVRAMSQKSIRYIIARSEQLLLRPTWLARRGRCQSHECGRLANAAP